MSNREIKKQLKRLSVLGDKTWITCTYHQEHSSFFAGCNNDDLEHKCVVSSISASAAVDELLKLNGKESE